MIYSHIQVTGKLQKTDLGHVAESEYGRGVHGSEVMATQAVQHLQGAGCIRVVRRQAQVIDLQHLAISQPILLLTLLLCQ